MIRTQEQQQVHELIESYVSPLRHEIKELQATIFKLMQANNLHLQNVSKSLPSDIEIGKAMSELSEIADNESER